MRQREHVFTYDWPVRLNNITAQSWRTKCVDILPRREQIHVFLGPLSSTGIISPKNVSGFLWVTRHKFKVCLSESVLKRVLEERHLLCLMVCRPPNEKHMEFKMCEWSHQTCPLKPEENDSGLKLKTEAAVELLLEKSGPKIIIPLSLRSAEENAWHKWGSESGWGWSQTREKHHQHQQLSKISFIVLIVDIVPQKCHVRSHKSRAEITHSSCCSHLFLRLPLHKNHFLHLCINIYSL